jgi:hypothetical protein
MENLIDIKFVFASGDLAGSHLELKAKTPDADINILEKIKALYQQTINRLKSKLFNQVTDLQPLLEINLDESRDTLSLVFIFRCNRIDTRLDRIAEDFSCLQKSTECSFIVPSIYLVLQEQHYLCICSSYDYWFDREYTKQDQELKMKLDFKLNIGKQNIKSLGRPLRLDRNI